MWTILKVYWICYDIDSILCFVFLAARHVGAWIPNPACWTSVPWPGIEPVSPNPCIPALEAQSLKHWATKEVPGRHIEKKFLLGIPWWFSGYRTQQFLFWAQVRWLVGELGFKKSCSRYKVETRLHRRGWGGEGRSGRILEGFLEEEVRLVKEGIPDQ